MLPTDAGQARPGCHTHTEHMHTHKATQADILPALLQTHHIFTSDNEDYTRRQW